MESQLLESINQNINEGIYRSDEKGLIYANKAFAKMFGYSSKEEILAAGSLIHYKNPENRVRMIEKLNSSGSFENEEITFVRNNGQEFKGLISCNLYKDAQGKIFFDGSIRDIEKQLKAKRSEMVKNSLLESINRNINEAIYRSIKGKGLVYANNEFISMFGYEGLEEIYSCDISDLYKNSDERKKLSEELMNEGSIKNREVQLKRKDGSIFWGYLNSIKTVGEDGIIYFDGSIRDLTKQKESDEALKYYADMQKVLINLSSKYINLPVDQLDETIVQSLEELGRFVKADRAHIFEYNSEGESYRNTFEWCREGIVSAIDKSQNLSMTKDHIIVSSHMNGEPFFIRDVLELEEKSTREMLQSQGIKSLITVPMMIENTCFGFVGFDSVRNFRSYSEDEMMLLKVAAEILVNIITRSKNQKQLEQLLFTANDQNKRLKDFSYITSHNFRASVANLISLTKAFEVDPSSPEYLRMLKVTTNRLDETITNVNELLNFEKGFSDLNKEECNIFKVIEDVVKLNNHTIREKEIEIDVKGDENLVVKAFSAYLESIFQNIITNAIKYGTANGSKKIEIFAKKIDEEIMVMIKDGGLGIDLDRYRDKLFKLGARFHSIEGEDEGQGMGLFITKQQIEAMGGRIEVESVVNSGTTFKLFFNGK